MYAILNIPIRIIFVCISLSFICEIDLAEECWFLLTATPIYKTNDQICLHKEDQRTPIYKTNYLICRTQCIAMVEIHKI